MKKLIFYALISLIAVACQTNKQEDKDQKTKTSEKQTSGVHINYDTQDSIPKLSETSDQAVSLTYKFKKGDSSHVAMNYNMDVEMMGQKMPMTMVMESKYKITDITKTGNGAMDVWFTRLAMSMEGPQPMKFDTEKQEDLSNNPMAENLKVLLDHKIKTVVTPTGSIVDFNVNTLTEELSQGNAAQISDQISSMADQFPQNTFITLPEKPVKQGDQFDAGSIETGSIGMNMDVDMKYKVLEVGAEKRFVILGINGTFQMKAREDGIEMNSSGNQIKGWIVFDRKKGMMVKAKRTMDMNVTSSQAGVMKVSVTVDIIVN